MNDLYRNEWSLLQNHFSPSMKLEKKQRIGSKYHKKYEDPKTPYQRIMENPNIPKIKKQQLNNPSVRSRLRQCTHISYNPLVR